MVRHVAELGQAQAALREKRYRALVRDSSDVSAQLAADGTILYESSSVEIRIFRP
jgi:PAS domain-containing protein